MAMKIPLLFLCHRIPYPPNKGDKIRSFHLLHHLSRHFDIYLATFVDDPQDWPWVPEVEKYCADSLFVRLHPAIARARSLLGLASGQVLSLPYYRDARMGAWVRERVAQHGIAHLLVFSAAMAQYALQPKLSFQRRVIDYVDVDSYKWQQYAHRKRWPMNWLYRREGRLLLAYEQEVASAFDAALFVSSAEAALFRELAPRAAPKVGYYNNGVNTEYFTPDAALDNPFAVGERALVFTGAMDYWPNIDAALWFARDVYPQLRAADPDLRFYVVGSSPDARVSRLSRLPGISVTGRVDDVRPYLRYCRAVVAPMRIARGVQNKVLEGMAMARPVIVTTRGLEGIDAVHGEHVLIADTARQYADCVRQVLGGAHADMGVRARSRISSHFSWDENLPEVVYLLSGEKPAVQTPARAAASA